MHNDAAPTGRWHWQPRVSCAVLALATRPRPWVGLGRGEGDSLKSLYGVYITPYIRVTRRISRRVQKERFYWYCNTSATHNHSVTVCVPSSCFGNTPHAARADAFCLIVIMIIPSACATACTHGTAEWHVPCPSIILCRAQRRVSADSYTLPPCLPRARAPCNSNQVCPNIVVSSNLQAEDPRPVQLRASRNSCHCLHKLCSEQCAMRS